MDGERPGELLFTLYDAGQRVKPGDRLVTFGSADYAAGVPIGTVTRLRDGGSGLARLAEVRPFVSFGSVDLVSIVVAKPATNPGDRLLTPRPVAPPTPPPAPAPQPLPTQQTLPTQPAQAAPAAGAVPSR